MTGPSSRHLDPTLPPARTVHLSFEGSSSAVPLFVCPNSVFDENLFYAVILCN